MRSPLADRVLALGASRDGSLRDALATALGDPTLVVSNTHAPPLAPAREQTAINGVDGRTVAWLDHRPGLLHDPALRDDTSQAVLLAFGHERLTRELRGQIDELAGSARRLLAVADAERRALGLRVETRAGVHLDGVARALAAARAAGIDAASLEQKLARCRAELAVLADGLYPSALRHGTLSEAISELAASAPLAVTTTVTVGAIPPELAAAAYFICSEGLANTSKYAQASHAWIVIAPTLDRIAIEVGDDGVGGASVAAGSGLRGLAERVAAASGELRVESPPGLGTRLLAELPAQ